MKKCKAMDSRCLLGLNDFPKQICPLAIARLRALERVGGNSSHAQESKLEGCPWFIADKDANYCFFKYIYDEGGKEHPTIEISEKLSITQAAVYSGLNRAISKIKGSDLIKGIRKK